MKFTIKRTSMWEGQPCDEAILEPLTGFMDCTCATMNEAMGLEWVRRGIPEQMDGFVRVYDKEQVPTWVVELETLQDIVAFYEKHGALIIGASNKKEVIHEIEIYDNYRE